MNRIFALFLLLIANVAFGIDRFSSYFELLEHYKEGEHFQITTRNAQSGYLIAALHGGTIERGTSALARLVAGDEHSLYLFESLLPEPQSWDHHITSTKFNEPRALEMLKNCQACVTIHGYWRIGKADELEPATVLLGGRNTALRESIRQALEEFRKKAMPELVVQDGVGRFSGMSSKNFVNQAKSAGVQIELSRAFRDKLRDLPELQKELASAIRRALESGKHDCCPLLK